MYRAINVIISVLSFFFIFQKIQAEVIVVNPGDNLNEILNGFSKGDTVLVKPGVYGKVYLSDKNFTADNPLIVRSDGTGTVLVQGDTVSRGSSLDITRCSYIVIEGLSFTGSMWGIYVKNSEHIILKKNEIYHTGQEGCHIGRTSKYVDVIENTIHHTGLFNPKWAEGVYIGSGSYGRQGFPDNCEYIWVEGNQIYETGNAEGINVKGECFHITVRNNHIHDIHPGTAEQYNQAAITVEGCENSIKNNYRLSEKRDVWVENNTISNVSDGYSDWNNGIMFFGTGVYILNNSVSNCANMGIYGSNWKNLGLENYVFGNTVKDCGISMDLHPEIVVKQSDPGKNPHSPQTWYNNF